MLRVLRISSLAAALLSACAITDKVYEKDGKHYGVIEGAFRNRWYNFYERGQSYLEGGYTDDAIRDFQSALELRPGDQRRARTYGLHFIDYFPSRELGIAFLRDGKHERALELLRHSLDQVDSGRAEFYYNEALKTSLLAQGKTDELGPTFDIPGLDQAVLPSTRVRIAGFVRDDSGVASLKLNGRVLLVTIASPELDLAETLELPPGVHEIKLEAWDLFGNYTRKVLAVKVDASSPTLSVVDFRLDRDARKLVVSARDESDLASLRVDGRTVNVETLPRAGKEWAHEIAVGENQHTITVEATDRAGNRSSLTVDVKDVAMRLERESKAPPTLNVDAPPGRVEEDTIFIDGTATSWAGLRELTIAGERINLRGAKSSYLRRAVPLKLGLNSIEVSVVDERDQVATRTFEVVRSKPYLELDNNKLSVAIAPWVGSREEDARAAVEQNVENSLVEQGRFFVLDRSQLQAVLGELRLQSNDLAKDGPDLLGVGERLNADATLMGWIERRGDSIEIYARLVNTSSGQILLEKDVYVEDTSLKNIRELVAGLGLKLRAGLPRLQGVADPSLSDEFAVTMENAELLEPGVPLLVLSSTIPLLSTPASDRAQPRITGTAVATQIQPGELRVQMRSGSAEAAARVIVK